MRERHADVSLNRALNIGPREVRALEKGFDCPIDSARPRGHSNITTVYASP